MFSHRILEPKDIDFSSGPIVDVLPILFLRFFDTLAALGITEQALVFTIFL